MKKLSRKTKREIENFAISITLLFMAGMVGMLAVISLLEKGAKYASWNLYIQG